MNRNANRLKIKCTLKRVIFFSDMCTSPEHRPKVFNSEAAASFTEKSKLRQKPAHVLNCCTILTCSSKTVDTF